MTKLILDLCSGSRAWSKPYKDNDYYVVPIDIKDGKDVHTLPYIKNVYGVLAAPDCTHLAVSGARYWKEKGEQALLDSLAIADACMRIIAVTKPKFWALENPVVRLRHYYGDPALIFDPCDYGDPYTKKTLLWGNFNSPKKNSVEPTLGSKIHRISSGKNQKEKRSITPPGFSQAFFEANQ